MTETTANNKTILIVDDDEDFRYQLRLMLTKMGFSVKEADCPDAARQELQGFQPDMAIVDLMMDEVDAGFTLCYQIKKQYPEMPVLLATAVAGETGLEFDAQTEEEKSWIKADAFLNKPIRPEQLEKEVNRLMA